MLLHGLITGAIIAHKMLCLYKKDVVVCISYSRGFQKVAKSLRFIFIPVTWGARNDKTISVDMLHKPVNSPSVLSHEYLKRNM